MNANVRWRYTRLELVTLTGRYVVNDILSQVDCVRLPERRTFQLSSNRGSTEGCLSGESTYLDLEWILGRVFGIPRTFCRGG